MTNDITERLRRGFHSSGRTLLLDAQTEITVLRAENCALRAAILRLNKHLDEYWMGARGDGQIKLVEAAQRDCLTALTSRSVGEPMAGRAQNGDEGTACNSPDSSSSPWEPRFSTAWERDDYQREKRGLPPLGPR